MKRADENTCALIETTNAIALLGYAVNHSPTKQNGSRFVGLAILDAALAFRS